MSDKHEQGKVHGEVADDVSMNKHDELKKVV